MDSFSLTYRNVNVFHLTWIMSLRQSCPWVQFIQPNPTQPTHNPTVQPNNKPSGTRKTMLGILSRRNIMTLWPNCKLTNHSLIQTKKHNNNVTRIRICGIFFDPRLNPTHKNAKNHDPTGPDPTQPNPIHGSTQPMDNSEPDASNALKPYQYYRQQKSSIGS